MDNINIKLKEKNKKVLMEFIKKGAKKARAITRANVLLLADENYSDKDISKILKIHRQTVWRIKKRYLKEGLEHSIQHISMKLKYKKVAGDAVFGLKSPS